MPNALTSDVDRRDSESSNRGRHIVVALFVSALVILGITVTVDRPAAGTIWRGEQGRIFATFSPGEASDLKIGDHIVAGTWRGQVTAIESRDTTTIASIDGPAQGAPPDFDRAQVEDHQMPLAAVVFDTLRNIVGGS